MAFTIAPSWSSRIAAPDSGHRHVFRRWHEPRVPSDGTQTATHGIWLRVGDRKFLGTAFFFVFDASRVLTSVTKLRINYEISPDGKTLTGTSEAVIFDPTGIVLNTLSGASFTMTRLSFEIPGDFSDFQKLP